MYKKLILTFTLAAGLSVLPNAFAAPSTKPGLAPKSNITKTTTQFEDSARVVANYDYKRPTPRPGKKYHSEDSATVLANFKRRPPPSRPKNNHGLDSTIV